jgi:glycosyltransferase involved in cell wall biosynthesis
MSRQEWPDMESVGDETNSLPRISVVVPSYNQGRFLPEALDSIFSQDYPHVEVIVMDGGSSDESVRIIESYAPKLTYWQSHPDGGQSAAINEGVTHATGEIVAWLNSDDFYCNNALWHVGRAHQAHPDHGLYLGRGYRYLERQGIFLPFSRFPPVLDRKALIHGLDYLLQPSSFFLRRAWTEVGGLDPSLYYAMDWDLLIRIAALYPAVTINDYLAVSREYEETKTSAGGWRRAVELQKLTERHAGKALTLGSAVYSLETLTKAAASDLALERVLRRASAEVCELIDWRYHTKGGFPIRSDGSDSIYTPPMTKHPAPDVSRRPRQIAAPGTYRSLVSALRWPRVPGHEGGETRSFHLLRELLCSSRVEFFALVSSPEDARADPLRGQVEALYTPEMLREMGPAFCDSATFGQTRRSRLADRLRLWGWPVLGPAYTLETARRLRFFAYHIRFALLDRLYAVNPDFLFITPQCNPSALGLPDSLPTRLILDYHDVKELRGPRMMQQARAVSRLALHLEAKREARFERDNLERFDGIIVASALDKERLMRRYHFAEDRILVAANGVDADTWSATFAGLRDWLARLRSMPKRRSLASALRSRSA